MGGDEGGRILCPDELKCCLKEADRIPDIASSLEAGRGGGEKDKSFNEKGLRYFFSSFFFSP